jgi:hypothetical protein
MRRENEIEQINQEGFVFKVFKPSSELKEKCIEHLNISYDVPKFNDDIVNNLIVEDSAFLISNRHRLLNAKVFLVRFIFNYVLSNFIFISVQVTYKKGTV